MGHPYCINFQHVVFRVGKQHIRQEDIADLHAYILGTLIRLQVRDVTVGGICDHVHFVGQFGNLYLPTVIHKCKFAATMWLRRRDAAYYAGFVWVKKYGSFSVSPQHVVRVKNYIENQARHHAKMTLSDEVHHMVDSTTPYT